MVGKATVSLTLVSLVPCPSTTKSIVLHVEIGMLGDNKVLWGFLHSGHCFLP